MLSPEKIQRIKLELTKPDLPRQRLVDLETLLSEVQETFSPQLATHTARLLSEPEKHRITVQSCQNKFEEWFSFLFPES